MLISDNAFLYFISARLNRWLLARMVSERASEETYGLKVMMKGQLHTFITRAYEYFAKSVS